MELLTQLLNALWAQDFETLANPSMIGMLYFVLFTILFLENGLLPAAFYWRQSTGAGRRTYRQRRDGFPQTVLLLTTAASTGCWLSYIRGDGWGIPAQYKTGYLICPRITISARIICSISMACLRCWSVASSRLSEHYCRPSQDCPA